MLDDLYVVIPVFNPSPSLVSNVAVALSQASHVLVIDDGSSSRSQPILDELHRIDCTVIRGRDNLGIAHALNRGLKYAFERGASHVLTLDQDSVLSDGYVSNALRKFRLDRGQKPLGILVPKFVNGRSQRALGSGGSELIPLDPLQSGMVLTRDLYCEIGGFREGLFIDCVDTEYALRARREGFSVVMAPECQIGHTLGERRSVRLGWISRELSFHGPVRRYYITRNRVLVFREYAWGFRRWSLLMAREEVRGLLKNLIFGQERARQFVAVLAGAWDGIIGRDGKIPVSLAARLTGGGR